MGWFQSIIARSVPVSSYMVKYFAIFGMWVMTVLIACLVNIIINFGTFFTVVFVVTGVLFCHFPRFLRDTSRVTSRQYSGIFRQSLCGFVFSLTFVFGLPVFVVAIKSKVICVLGDRRVYREFAIRHCCCYLMSFFWRLGPWG